MVVALAPALALALALAVETPCFWRIVFLFFGVEGGFWRRKMGFQVEKWVLQEEALRLTENGLHFAYPLL